MTSQNFPLTSLVWTYNIIDKKPILSLAYKKEISGKTKLFDCKTNWEVTPLDTIDFCKYDNFYTFSPIHATYKDTSIILPYPTGFFMKHPLKEDKFIISIKSSEDVKYTFNINAKPGKERAYLCESSTSKQCKAYFTLGQVQRVIRSTNQDLKAEMHKIDRKILVGNVRGYLTPKDKTFGK